jgi:ABC-2 type transport system ATP-binding protein
MPELAIDVHGLRKSYGSLEAVKGIDLHVNKGEVFSLLGPNGAGKTSTVEILEGHRARTAGDVSVLGHDPGKGERAFKSRIGIVLQETGVERFLTVAEAIDRFRGFYPSPRPLEEIIKVVGLEEKRNERVRKLSGGQQRRLDVAIGLAGDPELLFLDEPTTGFDPSARRNAWEMIMNLKDLGKTVFLTTHYMDEAQQLADRVAIIVDGRIVAEGPPGQLVGAEATRTRIEFRVPPDTQIPPEIAGPATRSGDALVFHSDDPLPLLHAVTGWAMETHVALEGLTVAQPSLEDVYLQLTAPKEDG